MQSDVYSIDGRTFFFNVDIEAALPIGSYVEIAPADGSHPYLGQIESANIDESGGASTGSARTMKGHGTLFSRLTSEGVGEACEEVFAGATMTAAEPGTVAAHLGGNSGRATLPIGNLQQLSEVPVALRADGFGRHTFLCGQSGSGKTYTLGVILERLLLETDIRIALLDPNSDYVKTSELRPQSESGFSDDEYQALAARYRAVAPGIHVFGGEGSARRLRAKFGRLSFEQQAMVLGLDPIRDPQEYNALVRIVRRLDEDYGLDDVLDEIRSSFDEDGRRLGLRIENLGIAQQSIWAGGDETVMDGLPDDWRMIVADLGSLDASEGSIASAAVLGRFWEQRHQRRPMLLVIDEAHNVCPRTPTDANQALATELMIRIAGEGRKFGLYLLLSTQRPSKVHPNVISQCDNLLLMKMNSATDIGELSDTFSFVPPALIELAAGFGLGQGLAAGKIAPEPLLFQSGRRLTVEGGSDVPSTWALQRS
jgi:DNA helicase HerA-like ATPase